MFNQFFILKAKRKPEFIRLPFRFYISSAVSEFKSHARLRLMRFAEIRTGTRTEDARVPIFVVSLSQFEEIKKMFWKIALCLGVFGLILSVIFIIIAVRAFYSSGFQSNTEDIAFAGLVMSIILLIVSFLITVVSVIFVMRNSKKEWEAQNMK